MKQSRVCPFVASVRIRRAVLLIVAIDMTDLRGNPLCVNRRRAGLKDNLGRALLHAVAALGMARAPQGVASTHLGGYRSRRDTRPKEKARSTSLARFWFCGRSSMWNLWNSVRRWVFTASTLRNNSSAMAWLDAGDT